MSGEILLGSSMLARLKKDTGTKMFIKLWMARGHYYMNEAYYMDKRHIDFPMTFEEAVNYFVSEGQSTNDYTNDDKAKLGALPTKAELETSLAGKQAAFTTSDELSMSEQNKLSLTDKAKMTPLIERAEACGVVYNAKTGYFSHNGIDDLAAAEVSDMLAHVNEIFLPGARSLQNLKARTNIVTASGISNAWAADLVNLDGVCAYNTKIEILKIGDVQVDKTSRLFCLCRYSTNLRKVIGELNMISVETTYSPFTGSAKLEDITLKALKISISFADCPLLSLASLQYLVNNAANTNAITVTVHPTVYAKLTDTSAELQPYLPENLLVDDLVGDTSHIVKISNGVQVTGGNSYFRLATKPDLVKGGQGKMTISCDVEGLQEGESIIYRLGSRNLDKGRPIWNITSNGRAVFSFNANLYEDSTNPRNACLFFDTDKSYTGSGLKLTNFKLSYGEHETLPYTPPLSSMTDAALKEKAEWLSLMQIAEAKQITFATTN